MSLDSDVIVVSGLPRSGTSLMMQMLANAGLEPVTDSLREADTDNPRGYFEFEPVKKLKSDSSWLPQCRGKVIKVISQLLFDLPSTENYRVIFMRRNIDEILASQEKMLRRLGRQGADPEMIRLSYAKHIEAIERWRSWQANMKWLEVSYNVLLQDPQVALTELPNFLGHEFQAESLIEAIDPSLHRNK